MWLFFFECYGDHRDLHVLTHAFPTRRSSDLYARTDVLTTAYMRLRKEGVPSFVTSHEAYRMTDGRVGTKGLHSLDHGIGLMALVKKADGDLHSPKVDQADCLHDERLPIPGLPPIEACMDCGGPLTPEPEPPLDEQGTILRARSEDHMSFRSPSVVPPQGADRMTDGRVGTKGLPSLDHGIGLMALVKKAEGDLHSPKVYQADCLHDERLPIPGLPAIEACMDCGGTFTPEPVPPLAEQGKILRDSLSADPRTEIRKGAVVSYTTALRKGTAAQWRVRYVDPSDGTLTLDLLGHIKRSTARFGVDPGKVTVRQGAPETY